MTWFIRKGFPSAIYIFFSIFLPAKIWSSSFTNIYLRRATPRVGKAFMMIDQQYVTLRIEKHTWMWNQYNSLEMTFQPHIRTRSHGALAVSRKGFCCRRNILRKVNFRLMCSMFRINADTASSNMLIGSIGVIPQTFTKRKGCPRSPLFCCFCTFREMQPSVSCLENTEVRQGVKKKMMGWCRSLLSFRLADCCG